MRLLRVFPRTWASVGIPYLKVVYFVIPTFTLVRLAHRNIEQPYNSRVGLVVSTCLAGAFVGSVFSGWLADEVGRRRALQLCALPMIVGASVRYDAIYY